MKAFKVFKKHKAEAHIQIFYYLNISEDAGCIHILGKLNKQKTASLKIQIKPEDDCHSIHTN